MSGDGTDELGVGAVCVWQTPGQLVEVLTAHWTVGVPCRHVTFVAVTRLVKADNTSFHDHFLIQN